MGLKVYIRQGDSTDSADDADLTPDAPIFDGSEQLFEVGQRYSNGEASTADFVVLDETGTSFITTGSKVLGSGTLVTATDDASTCEHWIFRGRKTGHSAGRGVRKGGNNAEWSINIDDGNIELTGQPFTEDWVRPAEMGYDRLVALQAYTLNGTSSTAPHPRATCDITVLDSHLAPDANGVILPAKTYPIGTEPREVVEDCATTEGKDYGVVIHSTITPTSIQPDDARYPPTAGRAMATRRAPSTATLPRCLLCQVPRAGCLRVRLLRGWRGAHLLHHAPGRPTYRPPAPLRAGWRVYGGNFTDTDANVSDAYGDGCVAYPPADAAANGWTELHNAEAYADDSDDAGPFALTGGPYTHYVWVSTVYDEGRPVADTVGHPRDRDRGQRGLGRIGGIPNCDDHLCLQYIVPTDLTTNLSPAKISDQYADWDPDNLIAPVFEPIWNQGPATQEDASDLHSAIVSRYGVDTSAAVFVEDTTRTSFNDYWGFPYDDSDSVNATQAGVRATAILQTRTLAHYTHSPTVICRASQVHLLRAGMAINIKAAAAISGSHLDEYVTRRIAEVRLRPLSPELGIRRSGTPERLYEAALQLDRPAIKAKLGHGKLQSSATTPHSATELPYTPPGGSPISSTDVQGAIDELQGEIDALPRRSSSRRRTGHPPARRDTLKVPERLGDRQRRRLVQRRGRRHVQPDDHRRGHHLRRGVGSTDATGWRLGWIRLGLPDGHARASMGSAVRRHRRPDRRRRLGDHHRPQRRHPRPVRGHDHRGDHRGPQRGQRVDRGGHPEAGSRRRRGGLHLRGGQADPEQ